jgi:hypothetical protein
MINIEATLLKPLDDIVCDGLVVFNQQYAHIASISFY